MEGTVYKTKEDVLRRAQEAIGFSIGEIDKTGRISTGKGAIGTVLEESWFGYKPNSESEPDFPEAGVELKATPYIYTKRGIRAKERLVINIINYMTEYKKKFYESDFWHKSENLLLMSYEYRKELPKADFTIDKAVLFSFPTEDLAIIEQDWAKIIGKIRAGQAHLLTEGDTLYLAACTKGATAASVRQQPFSDIPAKQRAYSLKSSYMTMILNKYIFGNEEDEHIIKNWYDLLEDSFENIILKTIHPYLGKTRTELANQFGLNIKAKHINNMIVSSIFGVNGDIENTEEFQKANIKLKTIRVQKDGRIKESMSFPTFKFKDIILEDWEDSELKSYLEPTKFLFAIFEETENGEYVFKKIKFWNIPFDDLEEVHKVWEKTKQIIINGVKLKLENGVMHNNLPKQKDNLVAHVRPHARNAEDTYELPDGRMMTKQCFWFNNNYIKQIIK